MLSGGWRSVLDSEIAGHVHNPFAYVISTHVNAGAQVLTMLLLSLLFLLQLS